MLKIPAVDNAPIRRLEIVKLSGNKQRNIPNKNIRKVGLRILLLVYFFIFKKWKVYEIALLSVSQCQCVWITEPIFMELGMYIMAPEPISTAIS
jgi:hypothetical protein